MPVKPENSRRYLGGSHRSKAWKALGDSIRERAGFRCEGSPAFPDCRRVHGDPLPNGQPIVLTVAHLDHQPENNALENLRAWCQRCHTNYDKRHHVQTRAATRRKAMKTQDLLDAAP